MVEINDDCAAIIINPDTSLSGFLIEQKDDETAYDQNLIATAILAYLSVQENVDVMFEWFSNFMEMREASNETVH